MKDQISIVVPVYNAEKTLKRCVASLQGQTYENLEIILVNDGSRDDSLTLCRQLGAEDPRIRIIDKPNGGVSSARNAGIDAARGKYIMFCDSDDWAEPDWCAALEKEYQPQHLTVCDFFWDEVPDGEERPLVEMAERTDYLHRGKLMCCIYNKIFARSVLEDSKIRFSRQLSLGEDFLFCLTYLNAVSGNICYINRKLYNYDTSNDNSLSKKAPAISQCELFYREITAAMQSLGATDQTSILARDTLVAPHYERQLKAVAADCGKSFVEKLRIAGQIGALTGFRDTCRQGLKWGNPIYLWLMQHGCARMGMLYLLTVLLIKKRV